MVKIAIVGAGGMGNVHYKNYQYVDDCEVVAIVGNGTNDIDNAKAWGLPLYESIDELVNHEEVDVIDVCTPTFLHYDHVMQGLKHNKDVICEKPLTLKKKLAQAMFDYAKEQSCHLYVAHVVQFTRQTQILKEVINSKQYGEVLDGYFERLSAVPKWAVNSWLLDKEKSGLIPFDLHVHDLDVIVSLFGVSKDIAFTSCSGNKEYPEQYRFLYKYKDKNIVGEAAWFNANIPFCARWRVYFEKGYLLNDGEHLIMYPEDGDPIYYDVEEKQKVSTGINVPPTGMYLEELKHFVSCIKNNADSEIVKPEQVIEVIDILETIPKHS